MLEVNPEESLFQSAVEALRKGDTQHAREFLTRLLKDDQENATYWVYMSAAVESPKERLYCLQTALKLDPENVAAKRGLVMLGAIPPDEAVPPFPMNNPRPWEDKVKLEGEEDKPRGLKGVWANPVARLVMVFVMAALCIGVSAIGFNIARPMFAQPTRRFNPYLTYTPTVTSLPSPTPYFKTPTPTFVGPTPLALMLDATYTPTPLIINTPHPAAEAYRAGIRYFEAGDFQNASLMMDQVITIESGAADAYYYKGLSQYLQGDAQGARDTFEKGIAANSFFAPNYVGKAKAMALVDAKANVLADLDKAIELDPTSWEAFMERARYYLEAYGEDEAPDYDSAVEDARKATELNPNSPMAYIYLARALMGASENEDAVQAARKANELDFTLLPAYQVLGQAYYANGQYDLAQGPLDVVLLYDPKNQDVIALKADLDFKNGNFESVIEYASGLLEKNNKDGKAYLLRGKAYMALEDYESAYDDLKMAQALMPFVPEPNILFGEAALKMGEPGEAYTWFNKVENRMKTDEQLAEFYYWRALSLEALGENLSAARDWQRLLDLPESAVTPEMRAEAGEHLKNIYTPTPGPTTTSTPKVTATATP